MAFFPPAKQDFQAWGEANENLITGHLKSYPVIKEHVSGPVGLTVSQSDWSAPEGLEDKLEEVRQGHEGIFLEAARTGDFVGVQAYSRIRLDEQGLPTGPEPGVEVLDMGYEYWPQALEAAIRFATKVTGLPVYVTENGIGTEDDEQRIRYLKESLAGMAKCIDDGIDIRGFYCWSLMDNFEWALGYMPKFGIVSVDRQTQDRTLKESARWLGKIARANELPKP